MPFAAPTMMDEDEKKKQSQSGGVNVSGASTSFATNVPGQESSAAPEAKQKSSGQYANIQSYLDANKTQADGMGQRISGDLTNKAEDATQKIQTFESTAPKVDAYDPNSAIQKATTLNDDEKNQYKTMKQTGGYTGPQSIDQAQGYQETAQAAQAASQSVKQAGSETGQQALLKQTYNRPQYTAGENRLDQVLLQNSAGSKQALEGVTSKYAGLDSMFNTAQSNVGNAINQANTQALQNKQAFTPAEQAARDALLNPLQQRASEANVNNKALADRVLADASDETLSEETLNLLGLSEGQKLYGLGLSGYVSPDYSQVGIDNVATAEERQKYAALAGLFDDPTMNQVTADGKAINPVGFNMSKFEQDRLAKEKAFNDLAATTTQRGGATGKYESIYADQGISDYLQNGLNPKFSTSSDPWLLETALYNAPEVAEQARQTLQQNILNWLNQQGYNSVIKKG